MPQSLNHRLSAACAASRQALLAEQAEAGHWEGRLSSSALSTATAVLALLKSPDGQSRYGDIVKNALDWLAMTQTESGGWGDTPVSRPNIATTLLCWSAFGLAKGCGMSHEKTVFHCEQWIRQEAGGLAPENLAEALKKRYGRDKTFSVPILMSCAIGGRLGPEPDCWRRVSALPFELGALPRQWFAALRFPVVSYALPALIAIGQARHFHIPAWRPWSWLRQAAVGRTLRLLREIQPQGGGFLEATPLTSFVSMALSSTGQGNAETAGAANDFLLRSVRSDGSWPIDTNLATWGTTLSIKALAGNLPPESIPVLHGWLENQQYRTRHPYCLSAPGGWAWTDLPGGVPDADDTAGALLALHFLSNGCAQEAVEAGCRWLTGLQNGDGGIPTFCKGWGALPFDRSAPDLTAHALAAWQIWRGTLTWEAAPAMRRAVGFLARTQGTDGSWLPLWFGNEWQPDESNPVFGTSTVLKYICSLPADEFPVLAGIRAAAAAFLLQTQQAGGGWGGGRSLGNTSIEETATALEALTLFSKISDTARKEAVPESALQRGAEALLLLTENGTHFPAAPIGLYFARLWYSEKLYPIIAATSAFRSLTTDH